MYKIKFCKKRKYELANVYLQFPYLENYLISQ